MTNVDTNRQRRWRQEQKLKGHIQVTVWVTKDREPDIKAIASAWREGEVGLPSTPKQRHDLSQAIKKKRVPYAPYHFYEDKVLCAIWLAIWDHRRTRELKKHFEAQPQNGLNSQDPF